MGVERISYRREAVKVVGFDSPSSPQQFLELHCSCWCVCFWGSKNEGHDDEGILNFLRIGSEDTTMRFLGSSGHTQPQNANRRSESKSRPELSFKGKG